MNEIKLKKSDYREIHEYAIKNYIDKSATYRKTGDIKQGFLVDCIIEAFVLYLSSKGYILKEGKVFVPSDQEGHNS